MINNQSSNPEKTTSPRKKAAAPRISTARHRTAASQETPETTTGSFVDEASSDALSASVSAKPATPMASAYAPDRHEMEDRHQTIARMAYGFWQMRGCQGGDPTDDWFQAEREYARLTSVA